MTLRSLGLIGFGNIARTLVGVLAEELPSPLDTLAVLVRPGASEGARRALLAGVPAAVARRCSVHDDAAALSAALGERRTALVVESAGHEAVRQHVPTTLAAGVESVVASVGALGDASLRAALLGAAEAGDTRLVIPAGALGGLDVVSALRGSGIESVSYRGRKPPGAWAGSPAESAVDLRSLDAPAAFYEGSAADAVRDYPKNANVAAALSLAGIGFERTRVTLIADPDITLNVHEFDVRSAAGSVSVRIEGRPSKDNPKTSLPTVYSLAREVLGRTDRLVV